MKRLLLLLLFILSSSAFALENSGFIKTLKGDATIIRGDKEIEAKIGEKIFEKDVIETASSTTVGLVFKDNTRISLGSNTKFEIEEYLFKPSEKKESFVSRLKKGSMVCLTGLMPKLNKNAMKIKVKTASMGVRGTHFVLSVDQ